MLEAFSDAFARDLAEARRLLRKMAADARELERLAERGAETVCASRDLIAWAETLLAFNRNRT